jgi:hypothetical protein
MTAGHAASTRQIGPNMCHLCGMEEASACCLSSPSSYPEHSIFRRCVLSYSISFVIGSRPCATAWFYAMAQLHIRHETAMISCKESGNVPAFHVADASNPITGGKGAVPQAKDAVHWMKGASP